MEHHQFTPGSQRALEFARAWEFAEYPAAIEPQQLLCGLLAEPECQAAVLMAARGIDLSAVVRRWPSLRKLPPDAATTRWQVSPRLRLALRAAESLLFEYPQPPTLATEHLLLGLAAVPGEVSAWLTEQSLDAASLETEVHRLAGHQPGPLPLDLDAPLTAQAYSPEQSASSQPVSKKTGTPRSDRQELVAPDAFRSGSGLWRALDAAANRAGEGLRVVEDYVRFLLDDSHLTNECKLLRHDLAAVLVQLPEPWRLAARNVPGDVGAEITTAGEERRSDPVAVAVASCKRAQQGLRSLEEFSKAAGGDAWKSFEQLRYRAYTLETAISTTATNAALLATAQLYILIDGQQSDAAFSRLAETLVAAGADIIQLRDKTLPDRTLLERAKLLAAAVRGSQTRFIMNDRPDLAVLSAADGVHVGQDELTVSQVRTIVGPRALVGVSTHSIEQARSAVLAGADYIGVGPTFASQTKEFAAFAGLDLVRRVTQEIRLPAYAIGGIDRENLAQVIAAGGRHVAVSGAVTRSPDPGSGRAIAAGHVAGDNRIAG